MRTITNEEYVFDVREGLSFRVYDEEVAQWLQDIIDDRDELRAMGALDCRAICDENEKLRHDIARHVQIAAEQAQELEELRTRLADAEALAIRRGDIQVRLQADLASARARVAELEGERDIWHKECDRREDERIKAEQRTDFARQRAERAEADLAAARALLEKLRLSARLYRGGGIAGQQMGNEHYSIIVTGHVLGDIDAALAGQRREVEK